MRWTTPDFVEISLNGEVTAYVNTDDEVTTLDAQRTGQAVGAARETSEAATA
jgi:coenzyme PQQ precursor peptide PqqA